MENKMATMFTAIETEEGYIHALVLLPKKSQPIERSDGGFEDVEEVQERMRALYGEDAQFLALDDFLVLVEQRLIHTKEMLMLLGRYGSRLGITMTDYHVYGSDRRPMNAGWARIPDAVFMESDVQITGYHTYVAVPTALDQNTIRSYALTFVSKPT